MFICVARVAEFIQDRILRFLDLFDEVLAACETGVREGSIGSGIYFHLVHGVHIVPVRVVV